MNSTREVIARALFKVGGAYSHLTWETAPKEVKSTYFEDADASISALKAEGYAVVGVEKVSATREAVVSSIAFLRRDWGTTRMVVTVPRITEMLTKADADLRAMLKAQEG